MTFETLQSVVYELNERDIDATLEYPEGIHAILGDITLVCGGVNDNICIDVCEGDDLEVRETIESDIPSDSQDVAKIVEFFAVHYTAAQVIQASRKE